MNKKYKIKKGDSWIKIANENNISLDDLLYWNGIDPTSRETLPSILDGQYVYVSDPYRLSASSVIADAPDDYADYGDWGKNMIDQYALAVKQGKMDFNEVPKEFQTAVNQRMITKGTDKFANHVFNVGSNIGMFLLNPGAYLSGTVAQKGSAYIADKASGRNDYGVEDILGHTPVMGREYTENNPVKSTAVDVAVGIFGGGLLHNLKNIANPTWRQAFAQLAKGSAQTAGISRQTLPIPSESGVISRGFKYQVGTKGFGKTGSTRGNPSVGYRPISSSKSTFNHNASYYPSGKSFITSEITSVPELPLLPAYGGLVVSPKGDPNVEVVRPEKHIYEQQSFNRWQLPNPTGEIAPHQPGTGRFSITGEAPIGSTVDDQALTRESINTWYDYLPRKAVYVPGGIEGTPSNIYSGLGILYGSENPGNLIIK